MKLKMKSYLQIILSSLLFVYLYTKLETSGQYQGPDYSKDIERTIKRYSREANQPITEINQKIFERRIKKYRISKYFKTSTKLK